MYHYSSPGTGGFIMSITILIADDHPVTRKGLAMLLSQKDNLSVVAETEDGPSTLMMTEQLLPDIIIMDISMPGLNGVQLTKIIKERFPQIGIIGLSIYTHMHYILEMLKAGALGYLTKSCDEDEIIKAIYSVKRGKYYLMPEIATIIAGDLVKVMIKHNTQGKELSPREIEILRLLAKGKTVNEISKLLLISQKTVESHRVNISSKLGLKTIAELARYAERTGLICE